MKTLHYIIVLVGIIVLHSCTNKQTFPSNFTNDLGSVIMGGIDADNGKYIEGIKKAAETIRIKNKN